MLSIEADGAFAEFDLRNGGRLASLMVQGHELLIGHGGGEDDGSTDDPMRWGSYPMVPWAGRVRHGRFAFDDGEYELPITLAPHAIHGTAYTSAWSKTGTASSSTSMEMKVSLGPPWPFAATLVKRAEVSPTGLHITLELTADTAAMPAQLGWHPWFRRFIDGVEGELRFDARSMYELDHEMIPTGRLVAPKPPPWDNCFTDIDADTGPTIRWPGRLRLDLRSSCDHWTVYTEPEHAICVEPQTTAPDVFNRLDRATQSSVLQAGETMTAGFTLEWTVES